MSEIILPTEASISEDLSPKSLVIISKPKTGKTSLLAGLPKCLILDFEEGSTFVQAMRIHIKCVDDVAKTAKAISDAGFPYDYVGVDTLTAMEDMCVDYAETLFSRSPMGKYWFTANPQKPGEPCGKDKYGTILGLPEGAGYYWLRLAFEKLLVLIKKMAPKVILMGHIKDIFLEKEDNKVASTEIDLTGKIKRSISIHSDSIGYLFRKKNTTVLSFKTAEDVICGTRAPHLSNEEIVVSEKIGDKLYTYWDKIFLDLDPQPRAPIEEKKK